MPERLDRVTFVVGDRKITMPWDVRDEMLVRGKEVPSLGPLCRRMAAAGASGPVPLEGAAEMLAALDLLRHWEREVPPAEIPLALGVLRAAICNELGGEGRSRQGSD